MRRRRYIWFGLLLIICGGLPACSRGAKQLSHTVRPGETLSGIGVQYGIPFQEIVRLNKIADPNKILVGQQLRIPRGGRDGKSGQNKVKMSQSARLPLPKGNGRFIWPVAGTLTSEYGPRNKSHHDGIDIAAPVGTPIVATASGEVIYSGALRGYGKVIIVRHRKGYASVYAHNRTNHVKQGQVVKQGQKLAEVGKTGRATGPNLHFEIRRNNKAQNPLRFLPPDRQIVSR